MTRINLKAIGSIFTNYYLSKIHDRTHVRLIGIAADKLLKAISSILTSHDSSTIRDRSQST
ncbi:hypothetical protein [Chamaesiphon sp. GL140_3_metabinner_50]|uniref:hypothetical protein n=1 Tax=Chamaesiphon sp. GL140_3_metabinner_50 TaxID=2970812 RepID=UPI0025F01CE9|nr:hypothetical protein [Chamaesiphon sp. GL140_3_metabinner_50]